MSPKAKQEKLEYNPLVYDIGQYKPQESNEPYWKDVGNEKEIFRTSFMIQRPLVIKGPTGTGKTTFTRRMHWELAQELKNEQYVPKYTFDHQTGLYLENQNKKKESPSFPLYIINGTEDTETIHILGGINHTGKYIGGPMYHWAHTGGILLVNELAEIRADVQTVFHGPLDKDRMITIPDLERIVKLPDHAMMVGTYNPGYQAKLEPLKISTKQRLPALEFRYPDPKTEAEIIYNASKVRNKQVDYETAKKLADIGASMRGRAENESILASREGVSTRLLVMAAEMIAYGLDPKEAAKAAIIQPLANNDKEAEALEAIVRIHGF